MSKLWMAAPALAALLISVPPLAGGDCMSCHRSKGVRERAPHVESIAIKANGRIHTISLDEAFRFHGHSCPGLTTTFKAIQYGFSLLFGKETPDRDDLAIVSRTPVDGGLDMLDLPHSIFPGIVIAQLVLSLAIGLSAWKAAFDGVNPRYEQVARSLGSSSWRVFWTVVLPLSRTGLLAGIILAWTRAMAEFGAVLLFCGTFRELPLSRFSPLLQDLHLHQADIMPVAMWTAIEYGELEYGFGIAFALVAISGLSIYALHRLGGKGYVW